MFLCFALCVGLPSSRHQVAYRFEWLLTIYRTCTSSIYTSTYSQLTVEFDCSQIVATLGLSLFVVGLGCGPMLLSPLSEFYGRRPIYIVSFSLFLIWLIP